LIRLGIVSIAARDRYPVALAIDEVAVAALTAAILKSRRPEILDQLANLARHSKDSTNTVPVLQWGRKDPPEIICSRAPPPCAYLGLPIFRPHPVFMATLETPEIKELQLHPKDTGSADVQVALLTRRITELTEHLKTHVKDHHSRRGLLKMVARRRNMLDYLNDTANDRYKKVISQLNLRK
jgi:small subunit ribosomal protein S15